VSIEEFLGELEKSDIITRQDLGKSRWAIILTQFSTPNNQQNEQQNEQQNISIKSAKEQQKNSKRTAKQHSRVRVLEKEKELEVAPR